MTDEQKKLGKNNLDISELLQRTAKNFPEKKQAQAGRDIREAVNEACRSKMDNDHRRHLGASVIGEECLRKLSYQFHWFKKNVFVDYKTGEDTTGRMLRLFNRGHREEPSIVAHLIEAGAQVWEYDPSKPLIDGKPQQFRFSAVNGHFGGSLDGIILFPEFFSDYMLLEMKTYNEKRFKLLVQQTVAKSDPKYLAQMIVYGKYFHLDYALFIAANKNDDDYYIEIVRLDSMQGGDPAILTEHWTADSLVERAAQVINSPVLLPRISERASYFKCKMCNFNQICHHNAPAEKNCRSCMFAQPVADGQWLCHKNGMIIPDEVIPVGCSVWEEMK